MTEQDREELFPRYPTIRVDTPDGPQYHEVMHKPEPQHTVTLESWSSGDWEKLSLDDEVIHEGHEIPGFAWQELLEKLGVNVVEVEVKSDEDDDYGDE